jgi:hypothetical protein
MWDVRELLKLGRKKGAIKMQPDKETMITMIMAKLQNMKPEELEELLDKLNHPDKDKDKEGEQKEGQVKPGAGQVGGPPHQQGEGVHDYGKKAK